MVKTCVVNSYGMSDDVPITVGKEINMAKKKAGNKRAEKVGTEMASGKVALQLRFDADVAEGVAKLAERTGVSVSQLMNAIGSWMMLNGHPGKEPAYSSPGDSRFVRQRDQEGIIWFGRLSDTDEDTDGLAGNGLVFGVLDFTVRRVVREE